MLTKLLPVRLLLAMSAFLLIIGTIVAACKRTGITLPPSQAHFMDLNSAVYFITDTIVTDTIPVGVTTVANKDRTVSFTVSSPSGALAGTQPADQYTLSSATVTIPAGQALGYIVVKGNFAFYKKDSTRKDTLVFAIVNGQSGGIAPGDFNDSFTLVLRGHCLEGLDFDAAEFNGTYKKCIDGLGGYLTPAYPITIISSTSTGPTSATLVIQDMGSQFFGPFYAADPVHNPGVSVNLDWSDPANLTATVLSQPYTTVAFASSLVGDPGGTFSSCHQTFVLYYDVVGSGFDSGIVTTTIAR